MKKLLALTKLEKLKLIGLCIKAATGIVGGSLILAEGHPYLSVSILAIGGVANEIVSFIKEKENKVLLAGGQETQEEQANTDEAK